jgi:2-dehydro-3-deoxygalactonokinase
VNAAPAATGRRTFESEAPRGASFVSGVIALDWGTSRLRAYRLDADGTILERRTSGDGAIGLDAAGCDAVLARMVGDWVAAHPDAHLIACGMVGARGGWAEAGYVDLPAGVDAIRSRLVQVPTSLGRPLSIVAGLRTDEPDVVRGEETQALGTGLTDGLLCMPGTHGKWMRIRGGTIESFRTWFTGELYELLGTHGSIAKALGTDGPADVAAGADGADGVGPSERQSAFEAGVTASAAAGDWLHALFGFRARVVGAGSPGRAERERLSGWLIGTELRQALGWAGQADVPTLMLVADPALGGRYRRALAVLGASGAVGAGLHFEIADPDCAARGLYRIATGR